MTWSSVPARNVRSLQGFNCDSYNKKPCHTSLDYVDVRWNNLCDFRILVILFTLGLILFFYILPIYVCNLDYYGNQFIAII